LPTSPGFAKFSGIAGAFDKAGKRAPGQRLRVEHLKDPYQLSSGTLREALSLLVPDALVTVKSQRGFRVAPRTGCLKAGHWASRRPGPACHDGGI
jgi:DNA-binding FadR family transcriptional regulator